MDVLKYFLLFFVFFNSGCSIGYIIKSGYYQADLLWHREPIEKVLNDPSVSPEIKRKLSLAEQAKDFAQNELGLVQTKNYSSYVSLPDRYVTYAVTAAPAFELKSYTWWFPIVGDVPYKGFFKKQDALDEEKDLKKEGYDTFVRGVSAYSTLGWFNDPLLSSMMNYPDVDLVNTVIHETVHATIYIKSAADFNERLATFIGNKGTDMFYMKKEGANSTTAQKIKDDNKDDKIFSEFISVEVGKLEAFYKSKPRITAEEKNQALEELKQRFRKNILPKLKTDNYRKFDSLNLNNALLMSYHTYMQDLSDFEKVFQKYKSDMKAFVAYCKTLENVDDPAIALKKDP